MYPFHQFTPTSRSDSSHKDWKVDEVKVAASIDLEGLIEKLVKPALPAGWASTLINCLRPGKGPGAASWCGCKIREAKRSMGHTSERKIIEDSAPARNPIFIRLEPEQARAVRIVSQAFLVEKSRDADDKVLARVVISCKGLNEYFGVPPRLRLPQISLIFALIDFFPRPVFGTADFRHYFYQFELPKEVRHLFVVRTSSSEPDLHCLRVWPMGFSWTPWVAQSATMLFLYEVRSRWEEAQGVSPSQRPQELEQFVVVKNSLGRIVAFLLAWYDNLLIIADTSRTRDTLVRIFAKVLKEFRVQVKAEKNGEKWAFSEREVVYLGIHFLPKDQEGGGRWCHAEKQIPRWGQHLERLSAPQVMKAMDIAAALGVVFWDLQVSGLPRAAVAGLVELARRLGVAMSGASSWSERVVLSQEERALLLGHLKEVLANRLQRRRVMELNQSGDQVWLACDASDGTGAGIRMREDGSHDLLWLHHWTAEEAVRSINWRETITVIRTLEVLATRVTGKVVVTIAEDNMTAKKAVNACFFPQEPHLCADLWRTVGSAVWSEVRAFYIESEKQPADEYTRGLRPSKEKILAAVAHLKQQRTLNMDASLEALKEESQGSGQSETRSKRPRE